MVLLISAVHFTFTVSATQSNLHMDNWYKIFPNDEMFEDITAVLCIGTSGFFIRLNTPHYKHLFRAVYILFYTYTWEPEGCENQLSWKVWRDFCHPEVWHPQSWPVVTVRGDILKSELSVENINNQLFKNISLIKLLLALGKTSHKGDIK